MAKAIHLETWQDLESEVAKLQSKQAANPQLNSYLLFRGQANSEWTLETTLDRSGKAGMSFSEYYRLICVLQPEIETFTNNKWTNPEYPDFERKARDYEFFHMDSDLNTSVYGYMAHLRHHGFPSPLLDWSRSLYVAAHFAFAKKTGNERVSIYALSEANSHSGSGGTSQIRAFGPRVKTHKRHFLQQCEYTMCGIYTEGEWFFAGHETAFEDWGNDEKYLDNFKNYEFTLPATERMSVLKMLDSHNLNSFSLFGSEESLMETLSLRELHFSDEYK
jgi:hypothetical protein